MSSRRKLLERVLSGQADSSILFSGLCGLLSWLDFRERIVGSHRIFSRDGVEEILNLQPIKGKAKPYQVKQVRGVILKYRLGGKDDA